jgi:plastocyanin
VIAGRRASCLAAGLAALLVGAAAAGCGSSSKSAGSKSNEVSAGDFFFRPKEVHLRVGQTITWKNSGKTIHTVKGQGFFSQAIDPGKSYAHRFAQAGSFPYLCTLHPQLMRGTVVVR